MSDAFDYYPETDTLIVRFRRAPHNININDGGNFTVVTGDLGDLVEIEIRNASQFLARAAAEGIPLNLMQQAADAGEQD